MNISVKSLSGFLFPPSGGLKSAREKQQRREDMEGRVQALRAGQASLKDRECDTLESIAGKLELYHSYESEIAAVKKAYNMEEMSHVMDEAEERGEKIADAAKKRAPKTEEERRREAIEEATGVEQGMLAKLLEENPLDKLQEELPETKQSVTETFLEENSWDESQEELPETKQSVTETLLDENI